MGNFSPSCVLFRWELGNGMGNFWSRKTELEVFQTPPLCSVPLWIGGWVTKEIIGGTKWNGSFFQTAPLFCLGGGDFLEA